jgi:hypothetical protein
MRNTYNSVLQKTFRLAEKLEVFEIENILVRLPEAKEKTLQRYLQAMIVSGNIVKDTSMTENGYKDRIFYRFVDAKPIKIKIGE